MLEDFLSKLGASTKITVGVSVSPSVGLEMIEVDRATGTVSKYSNKPLEYNHSNREIANYQQFKISLEELFDELHIPKKSNIILCLPNVHFGMINLPLLLTDEAVTNAIISEVEQSYIFKRQEPAVSWCEVYSNVDTENRTLAYTAIQQDSLDQITEICESIGSTIVAVENTYTSLLKALDFAGLAKEQMQDKTTWNLMLIGQNSYSVISMSDKKIMEYYEEPLALKSFVDDEIYNAIIMSSQPTLENLTANFLYIVSETDLVSAEVLAMKMELETPVKFLECNKFTQNEIIPVNLEILPKNALQITLEAIGTAIYQFSDYPLKLNILKGKEKETGGGVLEETWETPRVNIGNLEIELTPDFIKRLALIIGGVILVPIIIIFLLLNNFILPKEQAKLDALNAKVQQLNAEIDKYSNKNQSSTFDVKAATEKIIAQNETKLAYYTALGMSVPAKLWVTYYSMSDAGKIDIKGKASDVKSVYDFYKELKQLINNSNIKLYKLEITSSSLDDVVADISSSRTYEFEITNMTDDELNPKPAATGKGTGTTPQPATPVAPASQQGFQFGKPIFGSKDTSTTAATPAPAPTAPTVSTAPAAASPELPKNLEKIEKF
ncbi:MAG: PilN domain-containing protein [Candidatus Gastranaerophilales bacterium]|nr:PilN domain-containing protein [Candidatus Gastranaerophilales bacterium]